ncbi:MAG: MAPEG family protein [Pseudomonadota bacterium]
MHYVDLVAVIAVLQFFIFTILTGNARSKAGLKAPAVTGHEGFERMYRVQMNTLETLIAFLPALILAAKYWSGPWVAGVGIVYVIGRHLYWRAYISEPSKRGLGFMLSMIPTLLLILLVLVGVIGSLTGLMATTGASA